MASMCPHNGGVSGPRYRRRLSFYAAVPLGAAFLSAVSQDSTVVESPLPGGAAAFVRFLFNVPQWIQIAGAILVPVAAIALLAVLWIRRVRVMDWLLSRSKNVKIALGSVVLALVLGAAATGSVSWNYMQHDNEFCTGCHVMATPFRRFEASEHDTLSCHDCHQQSIFESSRQLYLWVLERPEGIPPHSPVPNQVCETCHVTGEPEIWQRIASTAGHRTHLESDSSALDEVECVTCHGLEVHRFVPVDSTCGQAGCHVTNDIILGQMRNQTSLHCSTCHEFTIPVPALATRDSAAGSLVPDVDKCFSCHVMRQRLPVFDRALDAHNGSCGTCHNPHEQKVAAEAKNTCATSECHGDWRTEPFHVGPGHLDVGSQCTLCHDPHQAAVDASNCQGCHSAVAERSNTPEDIRRRLRGVEPFDTTQARIPLQDGPELLSGREAGGWPWPDLITVQPDTFSHDQHADLSCLTCHTTMTGHGDLTFEPPRGCQLCHHRPPDASRCQQCHRNAELAKPQDVALRVVVADTIIRSRTVGFRHDVHPEITCTRCHSTDPTLTAPDEVNTCTDCHTDHHNADRRCVECHEAREADVVHAPPADAHTGCDACHSAATVVRLLPDRQFCVTCHIEQDKHYEGEECAVCHLQSSPEEFRRYLLRASGGS